MVANNVDLLQQIKIRPLQGRIYIKNESFVSMQDVVKNYQFPE
jgi:hypothetical protein